MPKQDDHIIIEFKQIGNVVKVTAIDTVTMIEASIVGDPKAGKEDLTKLAVRKLQYVIERDTKPHG